MGLTVQNLGVEAPRVLGVAPEKRSDPIALPAMAGWTWLTLRVPGDEEALEREVAVAAATSGARALAYVVDDSDDAYVVGATPSGLAFRLHVGGESRPRDVTDAAEFASVQAVVIEDVLAKSYVFAEDGVRALFAAMGLMALPEVPAAAVLATEPDVDDEPDDDAQLIHAIRSNREGRRWAAGAQIPFGGRWVVVAAEVDVSGRVAAGFCSRRDRMAIVGLSGDVDALRAELTQEESGVVLGPWYEVPSHVPRSLSATSAWALDTLR